MDVSVCIGSSCHLKGSYDIIKCFQQLVEEKNLSESVNLNAAFCLGHCVGGVTIKVGDRIVTGVNKENAPEIFEKYIEPACGSQQ